MPAPKSMKLFFIDNQGEWPDTAQLVGDIVVWPDSGKYPTFVPVAIASAADYDGRIVMMAGNRGLVMAFCPGAKTQRDIQKAMSGPNLEQYRIGLDSLVQRMLIHRAEKELATDGRDTEVSTTALLTWMARSSPKDAGIIAQALRQFCRHPFSGENGLMGIDTASKAVETADEMVQVLEAALAPKESKTDG